MKKWLVFLLMNSVVTLGISQDWAGIPVPVSLNGNSFWVLDTVLSDGFNYNFAATSSPATINGKWINAYHNGWTGGKPGIWKREKVSVENGKFTLKGTRTAGDSVTFTHGGSTYTLPITEVGCAHSVNQIQYPVYIEISAKVMNSVLASAFWLLSSDDTQEIDILEAWGSDRWTNSWFSEKRLHLSHHVFIRQPFQDWQPSDAGSFYTDGTTVWRDTFHRIGVYWRDPWHLEYYIDGQLVRTRSGKDQIDPMYYTNSVNPGDQTNDTRTGLNKPMDIIISQGDQTWRAVQGLTPNATEIANLADNTLEIDWVRVYNLTHPMATNSVTSAVNTLHAFPNPAENVLMLENEKLNGDYHLQLVSISGQIIETKQVTANNGRIELSVEQLPKGFYIAKLVADEFFVVKFLKE